MTNITMIYRVLVTSQADLRSPGIYYTPYSYRPTYAKWVRSYWFCETEPGRRWYSAVTLFYVMF